MVKSIYWWISPFLGLESKPFFQGLLSVDPIVAETVIGTIVVASVVLSEFFSRASVAISRAALLSFEPVWLSVEPVCLWDSGSYLLEHAENAAYQGRIISGLYYWCRPHSAFHLLYSRIPGDKKQAFYGVHRLSVAIFRFYQYSVMFTRSFQIRRRGGWVNINIPDWKEVTCVQIWVEVIACCKLDTE